MMNSEILAIFGFAMMTFLAIMFVALAVLLVQYIFTGLAIMTIAKNRGIKYPWLIWIPIANNYQLGAVADDINEKLGNKTNYRIVLLALSIIASVISLFSYVLSAALELTASSYSYGHGDISYTTGALIFSFLFTFIALGVGIAALVFYIKTLYAIFKDYAPDNAVVFTVLSVIFSFLSGPLLFSVRNKPSFSIAKQQYEANYQATYGYHSSDWQNRV